MTAGRPATLRRRGVAAVAVVASLAGWSCTRGGGGDSGGGTGARPIFRAGVVRPATLDPAQAKTLDEQLVAEQLFDGLVALDPKTLDPVPALAASWTTSPDQQHWDFTLRPGARFGDGSPITPADVKATFDRIARKGSGSPVTDLLEAVTGYRAVAVDGSTQELAGVTTPAPDVVRFDLDQPVSVLPSVLANPGFGVVPAPVAGAAVFPEEPVTSGPFRLARRSADRLELVPAEGVETKSREVHFVLFADKAASYDALSKGDLDWSSVPPDRTPDAVKRYGSGLFEPFAAELFYAFNLRSPKFADLRFREAVVRAVDRDAIVREVYSGTVRPTRGLIVDGFPGHSDDPCDGRCGHDRERATALLGEIVASGGTVPEIALDFEDERTQTAVATAIQKQLADAGIPAVLRPKPLSEYQQFAVSGDQELFRLGWVAPYASADGILAPLFRTGSPNNVVGLSSPAVDDQLALARSQPDAAPRVDHYKAAERAVLAELPVVPIAQFELQTVASPRVRGLELTPMGTFDARSVWVTGGG